ncbi:CHAT domain-containing protein [Halobacterium jilantaiense]|uniref:hypothetical protein n=1 Tax=Halobacterium jilantaiense TaxID=355548 RepID=UPI000B7EF4F9|nr:hypothetical protein [Halobacterium jilantaiense]
MKPQFESLTKPPGVRVSDPIENAQFEVYTDNPVNPTPADGDRFALPVDNAVRFTVTKLEFPQLLNVDVWTQDGTLADQSVNQEVDSYPARQYSLDMDLGPMKLAVSTGSAFTVRREGNTTYISFHNPTPIRLGARSLHESPAATITVSDDPVDGMRAVSLFGSALKTTSPERSFPTLRGHPPLVELGDSFDAPDALSRPETGIAIELPRNWGDVYRTSSLAFYLGADVRPGDERTLVVDGDRHSLDTPQGFERGVNALLKHVFFLDCVVRTEGLYPVDLHERSVVEDELDFDLSNIYDASLSTRLAAYLDVPTEVTKPHWPRWKQTVDVAAEPKRVESLPFVVNDLAEIRIPRTDEETPDVREEPEAVTSFLRAREGLARSPLGEEHEDDSASGYSNVIKPDATNTIEHTWLANGFPLGASKAAAEYYKRRFDHSPSERESIRIDIVCNDQSMTEEDIVEEFYGARDFFEFDISVHYDLERAELRELLTADIDFLHYIGHVEEGGFQCSDGLFDARTLDETEVRAFLLNACRSYVQGRALVDAGSIGGIVTLTDISNDPAVRIGRALARLLNKGFSLLAGLSVARNVTLFGNQYITVGDGTVQLVQSSAGTPTMSEVERVGDEYRVTVHGYPTSRTSIGSLITVHVKNLTTQYLNSGEIDEYLLDESDLRTFFQRGVFPVMFEGSLTWSDYLLENRLN